MPLSVEQLALQMSGAAAGVLKEKWPDVRIYAEAEFKKLGQTFEMIAQEAATGRITAEEAKLLVDMQKNAARSVLITVEGMGVVAAEQAINAALSVISQAVNAAIGFSLI